MIKKSILVVDDEPAVLRGMERVLHPLRNEWTVSCVSGGTEALKSLQRRRFDVIVSDVQMPGMTGADLLAVVRDKHPSTLRVILSGDIGTSLEGKALNVAHQVLKKPCSSEALIEAIRRAYLLMRQSESNARRQLISALKLPTDLEEVGNQLRRIVAGEDVITSDHLIKRAASDRELYERMDQAYDCKAQNGNPLDPRSLEESLGDVATFAVIVLQYLEINWGPRACPEFPLKTLWTRCGSMARQTAILTLKGNTNKVVSEAFAAGLLHNIGQLLVAVGKPEEYQKVLISAQGKDYDLPKIEQDQLGVDTETIAGWFLTKWGFPDCVCEAVAFQRAPGENTPNYRLPLAPLHVARTLTYNQHSEPRDIIDRDFLESVALSNRLMEWTQVLSEIRETEQKNDEYLGGK
ncbi:Uncharacterized protein SCG7086_BS_00080 [Chlamydiales bacterium SCGC AG-110-P3]|nr:Uncharacterized protein SCG7086_BS_00080 [Chlamydiales bacterium SCGC AG-110-P3]